jgi:hypothetical protein
MNINFLDKCLENIQIQNFMKICPVGAELLHADGRMNGQIYRQTDMMKLIVASQNFVNAPKHIFGLLLYDVGTL